MANSTEKEELIQEQVVRAAQQLYQQYGLQKVTMDDVAKAVGKGKSSLYYYYKSKEEIFDAVINVEIEEILAEVAQAVSKVESLEEKIQAFCMAKFKISRKRKATFNVMDLVLSADEVGSLARSRPAVREIYRKQERSFFKEILTAAVGNGEIRAIDKKEMDTLVYVMLASFRGLKREFVEENNRKSEEAAARTISMLLMNGLKK
jgi:AcrR family transcriptional regulator